MLEVLASHGVRTPEVIAVSPNALVLGYIANDGRRSAKGERVLARWLADLHRAPPPGDGRYGLDRDTLIGPLKQINAWDSDWARFLAERRLRPMAALALDRGTLTNREAETIERIIDRTDELIGDPSGPSLVHGDLWSGNVLWNDGEPAALIDPAVYVADREVELAFIDLMGGVHEPFWTAYAEQVEIRPGFWERRRDLYVLYPLLVHAALFGGGYGAQATAVAKRLARI